MPARVRSRHSRPKRIPRAVWIGVTGVVLGLVVVVAGALMNREDTVAPSAPVILSQGATGSVVTTPAPSATATSTTTVPATSTTDPSVTDPGESASLPSDAFTKPVASLGSLLPRSVSGFRVGLVETSTASAIAPLEPTNDGPLGRASIVVMTVFDKKTAAAAESYVDTFQRAYPKDLSSVTVGTLTGRFGTDGSHLAAVTFSRGRYAFEVVLTTTREAPRDLKSITLQVAEAFGATKTAP